MTVVGILKKYQQMGWKDKVKVLPVVVVVVVVVVVYAFFMKK